MLLRRLCGLHPHYTIKGRSLLHEALKNMHLCNYETLLVLIDAVKTLFRILNSMLMQGIVMEILFTNLLEVLLDGGAHQHFVYQHGKTAMDLAKTDEARSILWDKRKLKLKCISARAVKRFGLPYLGVVPKILEKFISMH